MSIPVSTLTGSNTINQMMYNVNTIKDLAANSASSLTGPGSSTDNAVVRFDGTSGLTAQNSGVTIADDNSMIISGSSSGDMLRITQTGAGNALLVEDSTNPDSTPFVIDSSGNVGIGTTSPSALLDVDGTITAAQYDSTESLPDIKPSLNLDFANVKKLDPRITYTRASTGTYYDGKTFAKAEENLLLQSQDFTTTWANAGTTDSGDTETAPDGTTTADTITATAATGQHYVQQPVTIPSGTYVFSVFAKAGTNDYIQLAIGGDADYANFDLATGVVGTTSGLVSSSITASTNGFYRCEIVITVTSGSAAIIALTDSSSASRLNTWTALGTETVHLWGAQLEQRDALTDYTPTTTQPITNYIPALQTAASGVARFDHDPITSELLGFLIEEQQTNLLERSEEFDNAAWAISQTTITPNTVVAPDGTLTGDKLIENTATSEHFVEDIVTLSPAAGTYTHSIFAKAAEKTRIQLRPVHIGADQGTTSTVNFNFVTGAFSTPAGGIVSTSATEVGNDWWRLSVTVTTTGTVTSNRFRVQMVNDDGTNNVYTGDGYSGIYIWGAQLEASAFPTSYIKTTGAQATRNADVASMTGTNFSEWYRPDEGTFLVEGRWPYGVVRQNAPYVRVDDGTNNNFMQLGTENNPDADVDMRARSGGGTTYSADSSYDSPTSASFRAAGVYDTNDLAVAVDGANLGTQSTATIPTVTVLRLGASNTGVATNYAFAFSRVIYYPKRLSNATLQALTKE